MWSVWVGYRYWHNKFGINDIAVANGTAFPSPPNAPGSPYDLGLVS